MGSGLEGRHGFSFLLVIELNPQRYGLFPLPLSLSPAVSVLRPGAASTRAADVAGIKGKRERPVHAVPNKLVAPAPGVEPVCRGRFVQQLETTKRRKLYIFRRSEAEDTPT